MILRKPAKTLFSFVLGLLNSFVPQYTTRGNEIIPAQVMKVPSGKDLELFNEIVSKEDPVTKSIIVKKATIKQLKHQIFLLFIYKLLSMRMCMILR